MINLRRVHIRYNMLISKIQLINNININNYQLIHDYTIIISSHY